MIKSRSRAERELAGKRKRERMKVELEMAMDLYTRSVSRGSLKQAWSGENTRAAACLGSALRDTGPPVS